jgi:hypothetical protein
MDGSGSAETLPIARMRRWSVRRRSNCQYLWMMLRAGQVNFRRKSAIRPQLLLECRSNGTNECLTSIHFTDRFTDIPSHGSPDRMPASRWFSMSRWAPSARAAVGRGEDERCRRSRTSCTCAPRPAGGPAHFPLGPTHLEPPISRRSSDVGRRPSGRKPAASPRLQRPCGLGH